MNPLVSAVAGPMLAPVGERLASAAFPPSGGDMDGRLRLVSAQQAYGEEVARRGALPAKALVAGVLVGIGLYLWRRR